MKFVCVAAFVPKKGKDKIWGICISEFFFLFFERFYLFIYSRGGGREKQKERNISVWLPLTCLLLGIWPTTQACAHMY